MLVSNHDDPHSRGAQIRHDAYPEINWSEVAHESMWAYIHKLRMADSIVAESDLTEAEAKELSEDVKADIARHYEE